jgi:hypothetical protein
VVAHAGQLHRRHDGARRLLAELFQLDSILYLKATSWMAR